MCVDKMSVGQMTEPLLSQLIFDLRYSIQSHKLVAVPLKILTGMAQCFKFKLTSLLHPKKILLDWPLLFNAA
jgi:hypothetical protein